MTSKFLLRLLAIILHLIGNFILVSYLLSFDWTGSWIRFFLFLLLLVLLLILFIGHLLSFFKFLKTKT